MYNSGAPDILLYEVTPVAEFPLPAAAQTHEIINPLPNLLVISQQSNNSIIRVDLDNTGKPTIASRLKLGLDYGGAHGLFTSIKYPGLIWMTLQFENEVMLLKPQENFTLSFKLLIPAPAKGPHCVIEHGENLWITCKDSSHIVRMSSNPANTNDYTIYPCLPKPVFVAIHKKNNKAYASLSVSNSILEIDGKLSKTILLPITATVPVGLITGPDGNVWFTPLGGNGNFGRINPDGSITYFSLSITAAAKANFIHLCFDPVNPTILWLLSSSMGKADSLNGVFGVVFEDNTYTKISIQRAYSFPTQNSMSHRIIVTQTAIYAIELGVSQLVHIKRPQLINLQQNKSFNADDGNDSYALFGRGIRADQVYYT